MKKQQNFKENVDVFDPVEYVGNSVVEHIFCI